MEVWRTCSPRLAFLAIQVLLSSFGRHEARLTISRVRELSLSELRGEGFLCRSEARIFKQIQVLEDWILNIFGDICDSEHRARAI